MARDVEIFPYYIVDIHSNHRITSEGRHDQGRAKYSMFGRKAPFNRDRYRDPYFLLTHAVYDEVNRTANNNWRVVQSGQGEIIPLLELIERLTDA